MSDTRVMNIYENAAAVAGPILQESSEEIAAVIRVLEIPGVTVEGWEHLTLLVVKILKGALNSRATSSNSDPFAGL